MALHLSTKRWQDQVILLLGIWLFVSPWALGYASSSPAGTNAFVAGAIMVILAAFDLYQTHVWAVLLNLIVGVWVTVSPWMIDVVRDRRMSASLLIVGIATIVLAMWELRADPELHEQWIGTGTAS
jgi:uncharacterized membrane protein HdeD (DUF308 family)